MESIDFANRITEVIVDHQGEDVLILDLRDVTTFTDYFVICTANSQRQLNALQSSIVQELKQWDERKLAQGIEGGVDSGWILIDYNSVIVHLFEGDMRDFYQIEELWSNARVVAHIQ